jgi:hypothetical protein
MRYFFKGAIIVAAVAAIGTGDAVGWAGETRHPAGRVDRLRIGAASSAAPLLYPGGRGDLLVRVANPNDFPVVVDRLLSNSPVEVDKAHAQAGCTTAVAGVRAAADLVLAPSWRLRPNETNEFRVPDAVRMDESSVNACQGAEFTVTVVLIGHSAQ